MHNLTAVLFQTHILSRAVMRQFRRLQRQSPPGHHAILLVHAPPGTPKPEILEAVPHHFVTTTELRGMGYPEKPAGGGAAGNVATAGDTDLLLLHFWKDRRGGFDRFWVIEYDVRYSGDWGRFFGAFAANDADLLATAMKRRGACADWPHWESLRPPRPGGSAAGAGGTPGGAEDEIFCLLAAFRTSERAVARMDAAFAEGWGGHCEVAWPSILSRHGMRVEDIGGEGEFVAPANEARFYSDRTFAYRPSRVAAGLRRDTLWHPVKPIGDGMARKLGRVLAKLRGVEFPATWNPAPRFPGAKPRRWRWLAQPFRGAREGTDR